MTAAALITRENIDALVPAFATWARDHGRAADRGSAAQRHLSRVRAFADTDGARVLLMGDAQQGMLGGWRPSRWDSDLLGVGVALGLPPVAWSLERDRCRQLSRGLAETLLEEVKLQGLELISCRADCRDVGIVQGIQEAGYFLADTNVTFHLDGLQSPSHDPPVPVGRATPAHPADLATIQKISRGFRDDHFHVDPRIPIERADALYDAWLENSMQGRADAVLVVRDGNDNTIGFVTCLLAKGDGLTRGTIELIATNASARGRGVGRRLVDAALAWFREHGADSVDVGTQIANAAAVRLYQRAGFRAVGFANTFHGWTSEPPPAGLGHGR